MHIQFYTDKRHLIYTKKITFCNTTLKFKTPRTVSNSIHAIKCVYNIDIETRQRSNGRHSLQQI